MKFLIIASLLLVCSYAQLISFTGNWKVNETDFNCQSLCCCPLGNVVIKPDSQNSTSVLVSADSWSNNAICAELNRTAGSYASYPFPPNIDMSSTPLSGVYNAQNEGFAATFFNVTKYVVVKTIGSYLIIDDANIGSLEGSICEVTLVKKVI